MILDEMQGGDAELRRARRASGSRRRVDRLPRVARRAPASAGRGGSGSTSRRPTGAALGHAAAGRGRRGGSAGGAAVRGRRVRPRRRSARRSARSTSDERAAMLADLVGARANRRHRPGPRVRGAALPVRDRLRLRRVPRPPAPPDAHRPVAGADARPRRRRARAGRAGRLRRASTAARSRLSSSEYERLVDRGPRRRPRRTRCASATGSATSSISTPARRCS